MADALSDALKPGGHGRRLLVTLLLLLALAGTSWGLAHAPLGAYGPPLAVAIACVKAGLVALVFMGLTRGTTVARFALATGAGFIVLLALGVLGDVCMR